MIKFNVMVFSLVASLLCVTALISCDQHPNNESIETDEWQSDAGLASKYPGDRDIEEHPAVIFASSFSNGLEGWTSYNQGVNSIKANRNFSHSGSKYLQVTANRGKDTGGEVNVELKEGVDELYLRFYTKFDENTVMPHHFVKIRADKANFSRGTAGQRPNGDEAFWTGIEPSSNQTWHFYTYWYKMHSWQTPEGEPDPSSGPNPYYGNVFKPEGQKPFDRDEWICVEAYMKANTPEKSNGEMAFWINGEKQGEWKSGTPTGTWSADKFVTAGKYNTNPQAFEGFEFRSDSSVKINEISLQWYVSKKYADRGKSAQNIVYFDDVVVATQYIGPQTKGSLNNK